MERDPQLRPYSTSDKTSFASVSAQSRWPIIITGAIDDVHRTVGELGDETAVKEGKQIVEELAKLKYELQHDRRLTPIPDDGQADIAGYNEELQQRGNPTWHNVSWLYSECYLYRRISTLFANSTKWKSYDIFARQKMDTFRSSRPAVLELAAQYKTIMTELDSKKAEGRSADDVATAEETLFSEMCEICLWGNATDLSLLTNLSYEDIQKLQGAKARKAAEKNILVNKLPDAFELLKRLQKEKPGTTRVDFVLDNAGFELFVDLILAGYLIKAGLAHNVILHPKSIPWFVSDVVPQDFSSLLRALADPAGFYSSPSADGKDSGASKQPLSTEEESNLRFLFDHWSSLHQEGQLVIRPNRFWTHAGSYWRMEHTAPQLYSDLRESDLVIFKGDLNGRKLTGDVQWPASTPFTTAVGPLAKKGSGLRILQLRTCKADVVVDLPDGKDEELKQTDGGGGDSGARKWAWSGKWAVVSYSDGL